MSTRFPTYSTSPITPLSGNETCEAFPFLRPPEAEVSQASGRGTGSTIVLRLSTSIFTHEREALCLVSEIVRHVRNRRRVVAVVSALWGATERLLAQVRKVSPSPAGSSLARLISTGEQASAALLGLALANAGVEHAVLDSRDVNLVAVGPSDDADPISIDADVIRLALDNAPVVVLPGSEAVNQRGEPALLGGTGGGGGGGADLTAVYIAGALMAEARVVRDIDGVYESDPTRADAARLGIARRFRTISWADAATMGDRAVQAKALRYAELQGIQIRVCAPGSDAGTVIADRTQLEDFRPHRIPAAFPNQIAAALSA